MRKLSNVIILTGLLLSYCMGQKAEFTKEGQNIFGASITSEGAKSLNSIAFNGSSNDTLDIKLSGIINEVCQAKGCWMTLESEENMDEQVFIKFKDYAFFVPKNAGGKKAIVKGKLFAEVTSVDELRHYAEDKGASDEEIAAISEPQRELKMMAEGVIIYN